MLRHCLIVASLWLAAAMPVAASPCGAKPVARIPVREVLGFVVIEGQLASQPVSLLLDSGAEAGLITGEAVRKLHLHEDARQASLLGGTGGNARVHPNVELPGLKLGDLQFGAFALPVGYLPALPHLTPPVVGLLGADILAQFDVSIALKRGEMVLYPPGACAGMPPWPDASGISAQRFGPRLGLTASLNGQPVTALLDTGARAIVLSKRKAVALGVSADRLAEEPGGASGGIDQAPVPFHWHRFADLKIGSDDLLEPTLTVTELKDVADLLLGSEWFMRHRVWMSWTDQRVWIDR